MAKVYEALRRAEEERKRRASAGEAPLAPLAAPAEEPAPVPRLPAFTSDAAPAPRARTGFWRRLWPRRGARVCTSAGKLRW